MFRPIYLLILLFSLTALFQSEVQAANLKPAKGDVAAPALSLKDLHGNKHDDP